jgi:hypothetical protein
MRWIERGIYTTCPQVRVGALAIGGFLECFNAEHSTKPTKDTQIMEHYFFAIILALIVFWIWLERDAF